MGSELRPVLNSALSAEHSSRKNGRCRHQTDRMTVQALYNAELLQTGPIAGFQCQCQKSQPRKQRKRRKSILGVGFLWGVWATQRGVSSHLHQGIFHSDE